MTTALTTRRAKGHPLSQLGTEGLVGEVEAFTASLDWTTPHVRDRHPNTAVLTTGSPRGDRAEGTWGSDPVRPKGRPASTGLAVSREGARSNPCGQDEYSVRSDPEMVTASHPFAGGRVRTTQDSYPNRFRQKRFGTWAHPLPSEWVGPRVPSEVSSWSPGGRHDPAVERSSAPALSRWAP
jgi:hypothetical protein